MEDQKNRTDQRPTIHPLVGSIALAAAFALASCATPESRLRSGLIDAGLSRPMASCMAQRMADRLSIGQLRRLGGLAKLRDERLGNVTLDRFLHNLRALGDPEIVAVATTSAGICAIGG